MIKLQYSEPFPSCANNICVFFFKHLDCPVSTDDRYEIIQDRCYYFEDVGGYDFNTAQSTCGPAFVNGPGRVYEPTSLSNLEQVSAAVTKRGMGSHYLGIDDSVNEGTYVYTSDNSIVDSAILSKIKYANCQNGNVDCDHLFGSNVGDIYAIYSHYVMADLVCENVNTIGGNFGTLQSKADKNGDAITKLEETNKYWFHATR